MPLAHESIHDKYVLIDLLIYCVFTYLSMYLSMHLLLICFTFICLVAVSFITRVYFKTFILSMCVFHINTHMYSTYVYIYIYMYVYVYVFRCMLRKS